MATGIYFLKMSGVANQCSQLISALNYKVNLEVIWIRNKRLLLLFGIIALIRARIYGSFVIKVG